MLDQLKFTQLRLLTKKTQPFLTLRSLQLVSPMTHSVELKTGHYNRVRKIQTLRILLLQINFHTWFQCIHRFHTDIYPAPPKFNITVDLDFSWEDRNTQEKLDTMIMQNFGGKQGALWSM